MSELSEASFKWMPPGEPIMGKTYRADGYTYKDLPRVSIEIFQEFVELVGGENLVWLSYAKYIQGDAQKVRGQVLVSPEGMKKILKRHSEFDEARQAELKGSGDG